MSDHEFTLHETSSLLQRADSIAKLMLSIDHGQVTDMHGALFGLRCILDQAIRQLEAIPEDKLTELHRLPRPSGS